MTESGRRSTDSGRARAQAAVQAAWSESKPPGMMERATPRERELFGFPAIGDPYWNEQTLTDVQCRYPRMDMTPYSDGARL